MRTHLHRWLPTAIALLALVVALGGPAEAKKLINGKHIKKGTIASKQLKDNSVTAIDVQDGGLTGTEIQDGSLAGGDVTDGALSSADIADGGLTSADVADGTITATDLKDGSVGAADLADAAVTATKVGRGALKGAAFDASGSVAIDFGTIPAHTCVTTAIPVPANQIADGTLSDDVVMATPGAFFAFNFSWTVKVEASTIAYIKMCNIGDTNVDPDAGGGTKLWRYLAIDVN
jgi:hypothetical protein